MLMGSICCVVEIDSVLILFSVSVDGHSEALLIFWHLQSCRGTKDLRFNEISYTLAKWFSGYSYFFMAAYQPGTSGQILMCAFISRQKEIDGVHYHFTARSKIEKDISEGKFLEFAHVHGNVYGTSMY
ncbi:hypothetical protein SEVIR_4G076300v4 [Setaria viridis]|uniref:Guanylate kinase-like domain-containing protein n=2 Tax=Setaria TaxID=4554 RepID=A0A368QRF2_SETIT|nr:hypothetical protein SETIT_4G063400v2 [Setaria italica]TKW20073.1 hypothetical protein SEVIR_4G076300v2 [Setaria viridis]TKW20074.1 hypothetical protein SEVIR_4G076300v2 [Setaria viridis]TKW20075.1 hypothetical protein SEVIR_4G076300v2 [Setaria viridis]TKW20081.1 hypothetical protein SEVIR_4G061601v2 [Setaria viridis]